MGSKITLKQIAEEANVSVSLVSLILNGKGRASPAVKKRVQDLLEHYGYKPKFTKNPFYFLVDLPRIEASGKTIPVMEMLSGIEQVIYENNLLLHVEFLSQDNINAYSAQLKTIANRQPSGVLIQTDINCRDEAIRTFQNEKIPLVQLGYDIENPNNNAVVIDSFTGAYYAVKYLINKGHKRIGLIRYTEDIAGVNSNKKLAGYMAALNDQQIKVDNNLIQSIQNAAKLTKEYNSRQIAEEMLKLKDPPTALFIDNSYISLPLLYPGLHDTNNIPDPIAKLDMIHFEDSPLRPAEDYLAHRMFFPCLNTVVVGINWQSIGSTAARLLIDIVQNNPKEGPQINRIAPQLVSIHGYERTLLKMGG